MNDGTSEELWVTFPADPVFTRIGRVTVAGLALRLGVDVSRVEQMRLAVDTAVAALSGEGSIQLKIGWQPGRLEIVLDNPDAHLSDRSSLADEIHTMLGHDLEADGERSVKVEEASVTLEFLSP